LLAARQRSIGALVRQFNARNRLFKQLGCRQFP
jgi:hypothetical protein